MPNLSRRVELRARLSETVSETSANAVALMTHYSEHLKSLDATHLPGKWTLRRLEEGEKVRVFRAIVHDRFNRRNRD